jgi:1-acyl-sn-glycerol-3-phosphate acyltransferase
MVRRSVRKAFHTVWWHPPSKPLPRPCIFVANHHGWHDGYLVYLALTRLSHPFVMWVQEYDAFPLFGKAGAMPFDADDQTIRVATIRRTIRLLKEGRKSLVIFPEGVLHAPPGLLPFHRSLELLTRRVSGVSVVPLAVRYEMSLHERPEAYIAFGDPMTSQSDPCEEVRHALQRLLGEMVSAIGFEPLARGTADVNERWDMRRLTRR